MEDCTKCSKFQEICQGGESLKGSPDCFKRKPEATESSAPSGQAEFAGCMEKPPLSLRPLRIAKEMRANEITAAMKRYWEVEKPVPEEWFDELKHLVG